MCGEITYNNLNSEIILMGWVNKIRIVGAIVFVVLRDSTGLLQIVFNKKDLSKQIMDIVDHLKLEFVIGVRGFVIQKDKNSLELLAKDIIILNETCELPFQINDQCNVSQYNRLKYRYLDLRRNSIRKNLLMRNKLVKIIRDYLYDNNFIEIETPILCKPSVGGAREFLVPSRKNKGKFFALSQSPQIFKQLLMAGGIEKYMQFAKCFRDEDSRMNRQPEFTILDLEMSFVDEDDIIELNQHLIKLIFKKILNLDIKVPFKQIAYHDCIEKYGISTPDIRFNLELHTFNDIIKDKKCIKGFKIDNKADQFDKKCIDSINKFISKYKQLKIEYIKLVNNNIIALNETVLSNEELQKIILELNAKNNDVVILAFGDELLLNQVLGNLRVEIAHMFNLINENKYEIVWLTQIPMFKSVNNNVYEIMHQPFLSPNDEDINLMYSDPLKVRAKDYHIIINGIDIAGGSIRQHNYDLQYKVFKLMGMSDEDIKENFGYYLNAFKLGMPPHGGITYGIDRLCMLLLGINNIKDTVAFPKTQDSICALSGSPLKMNNEKLSKFNLKII